MIWRIAPALLLLTVAAMAAQQPNLEDLERRLKEAQKAQAEKQERERREADQKAQSAQKARAEKEQRDRREAEQKTKAEKEQRDRRDAEQAVQKAIAEKEERDRREAEQNAQAAQEERDRREAAQRAQAERLERERREAARKAQTEEASRERVSPNPRSVDLGVSGATARTWKFQAYVTQAGTPVPSAPGTISLVEKDGHAVFSISAGRQGLCHRGELGAVVTRTDATTIITVPPRVAGCDEIRFVLNNDGTGGQLQVKQGRDWVWDGLERGLTRHK